MTGGAHARRRGEGKRIRSDIGMYLNGSGAPCLLASQEFGATTAAAKEAPEFPSTTSQEVEEEGAR